jgi:hypothetical protein
LTAKAEIFPADPKNASAGKTSVGGLPKERCPKSLANLAANKNLLRVQIKWRSCAAGTAS